MKKFLAGIFALGAGIVLFIPDLLPFIDEAIALMIFVKSLQVLGLDVTRWLPFFGKKKPEGAKKEAPVVDV